MSALARLWWLPALAGAGLVATMDRAADAGDVIFFARAGEALFREGWLDVYADPVLQTGPIQLGALAALSHFANASGVPLGTVLAYTVEVSAMIAILLVLKRLTANELVLLIGSLMALVVGLAQAAYVDGHPAQLLVPALWVVAGLVLRRGEGGLAGVLIGLSAGLEVWGLLGICIFAAAPLWRDARRGVIAAAVTTCALFGPFVAFGEFAMFEREWNVASGTFVSLVVEPGTSVPWSVRLLQAILAVGAGAGVAWALRKRSSVIWAAPLAAVLVRLVFDPVFYAAYLVAPLALALVAAVEFVTGDLVREAYTARTARRTPGQGPAAIGR
jgi:hypothetical protein